MDPYCLRQNARNLSQRFYIGMCEYLNDSAVLEKGNAKTFPPKFTTLAEDRPTVTDSSTGGGKGVVHIERSAIPGRWRRDRETTQSTGQRQREATVSTRQTSTDCRRINQEPNRRKALR